MESCSYVSLYEDKHLEMSRDCENLRHLPSKEQMQQRLTFLKRLDIHWCPQLKERCSRSDGEEWPKISHIPNLYIH
ncbi:hypothetical protein Sjap_008176 [Stephania japonica]|uniref:Uncharacterized protein n=1 Tax=Stephania japonica TaxID=461633 RepID=A0AAP0JRC7_9MAGN